MHSSQEDYLKVTCAVIINSKNQLLAAQRSEAMPHPLLWELPGGKIKKNEKPEQCIKREIFEEIGTMVQPIIKLDPSVHDYPERTVELIPYVCKIVKGTPHPMEHKALEWLDCEQIPTVEWLAADIPILKKACRLIYGIEDCFHR
jgi:8-oxo-dGTP diphosphatase